MDKVNLSNAFIRITEQWRPKVIGELNGQVVKLAKVKGEFVWHRHEHEDELFLCVNGCLRIDFRDRSVELGPGEMIIVPHGVEHRTAADQETQILLFTPAGVRNTGDIEHMYLTAPIDEQWDGGKEEVGDGQTGQEGNS